MMNDWDDLLDLDHHQRSDLLLKKVNENKPLWDGLANRLREILEHDEVDQVATQIALDILGKRRARKLNRISGLLKKGPQTQHVQDIPQALDDQLLGDYRLLSLWQDPHSPKGLTRQASFYVNNHLLVAMRVARLHPAVLDHFGRRLQEQWKELSSDEEPVIIAHRGDGATFEKVRKVFPREYFDVHYKHENENSPQAVTKALDAWLAGDLAGVECDVWFSQDEVPIIIHSQHIGKLYWQQQKPKLDDKKLAKIESSHDGQWSAKPTVKDVTAEDAIAHGFLTLPGWLQLIEDFVSAIPPGKSALPVLRVEIEMKDERLKQYDQWVAVERIVSRFLKNCADPIRYEVALFNGEDAPISGTKRVEETWKVGLSTVVYGGGKPTEVYVGEKNLREVRFGLHTAGLAAKMEKGDFAGKIVTLAPGVEALPESQDFTGSWKLRQLKTTGFWIENHDALTVEQAIQAARLHILLKLHKSLQGDPRQALRIQVLTDFGGWGAKYIRQTQSVGVGGIKSVTQGKRKHGSLARPIDLQCIQTHYALLDDELTFVHDELVETRQSSAPDKYLAFGLALLERLPGKLT